MITGFAKNLVAGIFILAVVVCFAYIAACSISNWQMVYGNEYNIPDSNKAEYSLRIRNTGNILLTDKLERQGDILLLDGFWQMNPKGDKFKYTKELISLDQSIFGPIDVTKR